MARRIAFQSDHKRFKHVSIITSGRKILAVGYNKGEEHSEAVAIKRLNHHKRNNGDIPHTLTITNLMFKTRNGNLGNSFPCIECITAISKARIRWITYVENGVYRTI